MRPVMNRPLRLGIIGCGNVLRAYGPAIQHLRTRGLAEPVAACGREAQRDFEQSLKINPRDDGALYGLSQALREAKEYAGAQSALNDLISRSGNFVYWLEWGRIVMIRYWWALLLLAIGWALKVKLMKARTQANG